MRLEPSAYGGQRFLPKPVAVYLAQSCGRAGGGLLLIALAVACYSLFTSAFMGFATVAADLVLHSAGVASAVGFLAPALIGWDLVYTGRSRAWRTRFVFLTLAMLALAGALAALPLAAAWPLSNGLGGMLGERLVEMGAGLLAVAGIDRGGAVAGLLLFVLGAWALTRGLGLDVRGVMAGLRCVRSARCLAVEARARSMPSTRSRRGTHDRQYRYEPELPFPRDESPARQAQSTSGPQSAPAPILEPSSECAALDHDTLMDAESRAIAARFAPSLARRKNWAGRKSQAAAPAWPGPQLGGEPPRPVPSRTAVREAAVKGEDTGHDRSGRLLTEVLAGFGIGGEVLSITPGPAVTLFEFRPARPVKPSRLMGLSSDLAQGMGVPPVRVTVLPGRDAIGLELANSRRETVPLWRLTRTAAFRSPAARLPLAIGMAIGGEAIVADLARMPHLLVSGGTGSGKSMGLHAMVLSLILRHDPATCRLLLIDPKMVELPAYDGIPHLLTPVVTECGRAAAALAWVVAETERRSAAMAKLAVSTIEDFNTRVRAAGTRGEAIERVVETGFDEATGTAVYERHRLSIDALPYIVVAIDELAELMAGPGKGITSALSRLARSGRAAGIHLVITTQRPSAGIVAGAIKANMPARISYRAASRLDSRMILDEPGAEQLLGGGDLLLSSGPGQAVRLQGPFVSREEIADAVGRLRGEARPPHPAIAARSSLAHAAGGRRAPIAGAVFAASDAA